MEMSKLSLKEFADVLASDAPAPGGGSVAALCASLSISLSSMVYSLTVGKKFFNEYDESVQNKMKEFLVVSNELKDEFLHLMDVDTEAFNKVMAAFKMPKETDEEKAIRSAKIQESYVEAMEVPLSVAKKTYTVFEYLEFAANYGNPNAASDAGVGALLALTALESAILNVRINLGSIKNAEITAKAAKECDELVKAAYEKKESIMGIVNSKL